MKLSAAGKVERGKELTPARLFAFELWQENPQITAAELDKALKEKGFEIAKTTRATWLTRFRKGKRVRTYEGKPLTAMQPSEITPAVKPGEITLEQIIKAVGSVEALSLLFYQGVMEELKRRDAISLAAAKELNEVIRIGEQIEEIQELEDKLASKKTKMREDWKKIEEDETKRREWEEIQQLRRPLRKEEGDYEEEEDFEV